MSSASPPKMTVVAAWAAWGDGSAAAGSEFLERVSAWTQGTTAQLLRARWRPGTPRPTSAELQGRLRHHLEVVARSGLTPYPEALEVARRGLIAEIAGGEVPAQAVDRQSRRPRGRRLF